MDRFILTKATEVFTTLGRLHRENAYQSGLVVELRDSNYNPIKEFPVPIIYKNHVLTTYYIDIVINNNIPIETKTIKKLTDKEFHQIINYMKYIHSDIGYLINFSTTADFEFYKVEKINNLFIRTKIE